VIDVAGLKLASLSHLILSGQHTAEETTRAYLERIARLNPPLNAYIDVFEDTALAQARQADAELRDGRYRGPLHGIPIAVKDMLDVEGRVTSAGGRLLPTTPAAADAEVVARLRQAGAVILGKLNLHEYAWGGTTDNPHFRRCQNPWKTGFTPGGSSGGAGAAVVAGLCAAAIGTDTLGSVRIPASYCGCAGVKPTHGLVSRRGVFPLAWSLDTVGPLAADAEDAALVLLAIAGPDPADPYSAGRELGRLSLDEEPSAEGIRLAVVKDYTYAHDGSAAERVVREAVRAAVERLAAAGAELIELDVPQFQEAGETAITIALAEAAAIHEERLRSRPEAIGEDVRRRLEAGLTLSPAVLARAYHRRQILQREVPELIKRVDGVILPTTTTAAHAFDPARAIGTARYTAAANALGLPAVSVRCGFTPEGLPIGMQIISLPFEEVRAIWIARTWEALSPFADRRPDGV